MNSKATLANWGGTTLALSTFHIFNLFKIKPISCYFLPILDVCSKNELDRSMIIGQCIPRHATTHNNTQSTAHLHPIVKNSKSP